jgi:hypothetical protein
MCWPPVLIVTPNGYNVGKLYSVIPNTTLGDMDVSRALSATRVNEQKFIEIARTNLVPNGLGYNPAAGVLYDITITDSPAIGINATRITKSVTGGGNIYANQDCSTAVLLGSTTYTLSRYFKYDGHTITTSMQYNIGPQWGSISWNQLINISSTGVTLGTSSACTSTIQNAGNGWYRVNVTITTGAVIGGTPPAPVSYLMILQSSLSTGQGFLTALPQLEVGTNATDYIQTTTVARTKFAGITQDGLYGANIPRIDYPPLGGCPSILVEPARTNLVLYSEEFDNASWSKTNVVVTANSTASPNGTLTADLISYNSTTNNLLSFSATNAITTTYTISVFAKKGTGSVLRIREVFYTGTISTFDLNTGTVLSGIGKIESYPNGWYRCSITQAYTNLQTSINWSFDSNLNIYNLYLWGAQCEEGSTLTSYIPTTTAAVPRNADEIRNINATTLIGQTEGTIYAEVIGTKDILAVNKYICIIGGGSKSIHIAFYLSVINIVSFPPIDLSVSFTPNLNYKIAVCYSNTGNFRVYVNGFKYHEVNTYVPATFSTLGIGNTVGGTNQVNSNIKSAVLWKTALTDDQCILLTAASFSTYPEMANNFPNTLIYTLQ